jgi:hypothetical protein
MLIGMKINAFYYGFYKLEARSKEISVTKNLRNG